MLGLLFCGKPVGADPCDTLLQTAYRNSGEQTFCRFSVGKGKDAGAINCRCSEAHGREVRITRRPAGDLAATADQQLIAAVASNSPCHNGWAAMFSG